MAGEFFTVLFSKKILTNNFFISFKCRKAKDGDNDHGRRETDGNGMDDMGKDTVEEEAMAGKFLPFL